MFSTKQVPLFAMMAGAGLSAYLEDRFKWPTLLAFATTVAVIPGRTAASSSSNFDNNSRLIA